jgi:hypothetical protein
MYSRRNKMLKQKKSAKNSKSVKGVKSSKTAHAVKSMKKPKPAVKSKPAASIKAARGSNSRRLELEKELIGYIKKVNEEGLIFLLKQAHVISHNMEVDKINDRIVEYEGSKARNKDKTGKPVPRTTGYSVEIKGEPEKKSFIIVFDKARKIFNLQEMRSIVKICENSSGDKDASVKLYRWFLTNRQDVLGDTGIGSAGHPILPVLYSTVKKTYRSKR